MKQEAIFLTQYKNEMYSIIEKKYKDKNLDKKKIMKMIDSQIQKTLNNRKVSLVNNYTNKTGRTDILTLIDFINNSHLIMAGGGCLFMPHGTVRNLLCEFIIYKQEERKALKKERKKYDKSSFEWLVLDIAQNNVKLVLNSQYGVSGYPRYIMYNVFIAECITSQGKAIITSCIAAFENFMGDGIVFSSEGEAVKYINNIANEYYYNEYYNIIDPNIFDSNELDDIYNKTITRILSKCSFKYNDTFKSLIEDSINNMDIKLVILLYYKNNLKSFNNNSFMKDNIKYILDNNGELVFGDPEYLKNDKMRECSNRIMDIYKLFVIYNYPLYDKVRKAMYHRKNNCLYTDTDSVFISLNSLVNYIRYDVLDNKPIDGLSMRQTETTGAFLMFIYIDKMVDMALKTLCAVSNIPEDVAKLLYIKNEYFYQRIAFMEKKKRYIALALFQEGQLLGKGKGMLDIKGLDFIKSTTNSYVKEYYMNIIENDIMLPEQIKPNVIFRKMIALKEDMEYAILHGDRKYFKQGSPKTPESYKNPFSTQGVVATILWNTLCPDMAIDLPGEIYIVPIKDMTFIKPKSTSTKIKSPMDYPNIESYASEYPEAYNTLYHKIYCNPNSDIRHMTLKFIAFPRNEKVIIPDHIYALIDYAKISRDALGLFLPVMNSVGLKSLPTSSDADYMSNIVEL